MKRISNIYEKICSKQNILLAIYNASRGKKQRQDVMNVINNITLYVDKIEEMLVNKTYRPSPYTIKKIYDGANKKERIIYKPRFYPDQIIHWCLMQQITDVLKRGMYDYCCASIPNRGVQYGARFIKKILVRDIKNTKYCLKLDIRHFYPSIDKQIMKSKVRKIIKDTNTIYLLDLIIDSNEHGLPIR